MVNWPHDTRTTLPRHLYHCILLACCFIGLIICPVQSSGTQYSGWPWWVTLLVLWCTGCTYSVVRRKLGPCRLSATMTCSMSDECQPTEYWACKLVHLPWEYICRRWWRNNRCQLQTRKRSSSVPAHEDNMDIISGQQQHENLAVQSHCTICLYVCTYARDTWKITAKGWKVAQKLNLFHQRYLRELGLLHITAPNHQCGSL